MAGLQYNFFPTDILYPRSSPSSASPSSSLASQSKSVPLQTSADKAPALPLQQYYFFPTDYFYPRPQSSVQVSAARMASTSAAAPLPILKKSSDVQHNLGELPM